MNERVRVGGLPFDEPHPALGEPGKFDYIKICLLQASHSRPIVCTKNTAGIQARLEHCWCMVERATSATLVICSHMSAYAR